MSGHNHRRGGGRKDQPFNEGQRTSGYVIFSGHGETPLSGARINAYAVNGDATCGSRGVRRDKAGAKSFIHTRTRRTEDRALKTLAAEVMAEDHHKD